MAKYKVLHDFKDSQQNLKQYTADEVVEFAVKRATEINALTQEKHQLDVLERIVEVKDKENEND